MRKNIFLICGIFIGLFTMFNIINIKAEELNPGVYDAEDNLIASWEDLVNNYHLKIDKDYTETNYSGFNGNNFDNGTSGNAMTYVLNQAGMENVTKVVLPDGLTKIGKYAFGSSTKLTTIIMKEGILNIGKYAFKNCTNLTSIVIPASVTNMDISAFDNCTNLLNINIDTENQNYAFEDGALFNKNKTILLKYLSGNSSSEYVVPDSVTIIAENAFYNCLNLTKVTISKNVTDIEASAFANCKNLTDVIFENGSNLANINNNAFYNCENLNNVEIPKSVINIGNSVFSNCYKLKNLSFENGSQLKSIGSNLASSTYYIEIPNSVTSLASNTFNSNATILYNGFAGTDEDKFGAKQRIFYIENDWKYYDRNKTKAEYAGQSKDIVVPKNITYLVKISNGKNYEIKNITFEEGSQLTTIGSNALWGLYVKNLKLPKTLTTIESNGIATSWLDYLEIPDNVTFIGNNAFKDVFSIKYNGSFGSIDDKWGAEYRIHSEENGWAYTNEEKTSAIYIGNKESIIIPKNITELLKVISDVTSVTYEEDSQLTTIKEGAFRKVGTTSNLTNIKIPKSVTTIEKMAFYYNTNLTNIEFEEDSQLETIGEDAFYYNKINVFIVPETVTSITGKNTFYGTKYLIYSGLAGTEKDKWGAKYRAFIDGKFLYESSDKKSLLGYLGNENIINIPDNVETIKSLAFYDNKDIEEIIFSKNSKLKSIGDSAFSGCVNLEKFVFPTTIETLGYSVFAGTKIKEIIIPKNLTTISSYAFQKMSYLNKIIIEPGVTISQTPSAIFQDDKNVKEIIISDGEENVNISNIFSNIANYVEKIIVGTAAKNGGYSFSNFTNLKEVVIKEGNIVIPNNAFFGSNLEQIIIPASVKTIGNSAFYSNKNLKNIIFKENSSLSEIGKEAFMIPSYAATNAINIEYLELPNSVITIGSNAFYKKVKYLVLDNELSGTFGATQRLFSIKNNWGYTDKEKTSAIYLGNSDEITVPEDIKKLSNLAFENMNIKKLIITESTNEIMPGAFRDAAIKNLTILNKEIIVTGRALQTGIIDNVIGYKDSTAENFATTKNINFITILEKSQVSDIDSIIRITDEEINPDVVVTVGNKVLVKDVDYLVSYENVDRPGIGKAIITGINQYAGEVIKEFTIKPEEGVIKKVDSDKNINNLSFENTSVNNLITITDADLKQLDNGKNISLFIESDIIEDTPEENSLIVKELTSNESIGVYMDINLYKQIDGEDKIKIEETEEDVTISFEIPEELLKDGREFYIIKVHNGVVTKIYPTKIEGNILTFNTKEFSTYALVYKDTVNNEIINNSDNNSINKLPDTGVTQPFGLLLIGFISLIGYVIIKRESLN